MRTPTIVMFAVISLALRASTGAAQTQRTGFVNSAKIFQEVPEAKEAENQLARYAKPIQDSLAAMQKAIEDKIAEYQKKESMMNDAAKRSSQQEIQDMTVRAREYASRKDQELAAQREKILGPLKEKIFKAIERVAKEEKYNFVFDHTEQVQIDRN